MNVHLEFSCTSELGYLEDAKRNLIELMVQKRQAIREANELEDKIADYEGFAKEALDADQELLAQEIAEKIGAMESELKQQQTSTTAFLQQVTYLEGIVRRLERNRKYPLAFGRCQYLLDYLDAAAQLAPGGDNRELERKMFAAGIGRRFNGGQEVLARIRSERENRDQS